MTGDGAEIGEWLLENQDVNMFTFTGSPRVGELIRSKAGLRKVSLELGNNSATVVHKDADLEKAASLISQKALITQDKFAFRFNEFMFIRIFILLLLIS